VLATVAGLAVVVITGDLFLYQRVAAPMRPMASTSAELSQKPLADTVAPQPSFEAKREADVNHFASAPVAPAPPPAPPANVADAPKSVHTEPIRGGAGAPNRRAAPRPLSLPDRDAALSLAEEQNSRAASAQRKTATQPSAPQIAAVPVEPAPASAAASGGLAPSFIWPLRGALIAGFGAETNGGHNDGIDIAVPVGSDIHAAGDGVVVYASDDIKGYGNLVLLRHSGGFVTAYAHADKILVKLNNVVHRGQVIAKSGRVGNVPLLHFEIRKGSTPIDPMQFLPRG
jgi:murein DD-endopeptidase MepM/ murein hydrolase activator NlpD